MTVTNKAVQNIHLFATAALFNANKSSLTDADIALIKATGITDTYDLGNIIDSSFGNENGYVKYSNGLIIQWLQTDSSETVTDWKQFPISFPNECYVAIACDCWHDRSQDDKKYYKAIRIQTVDGVIKFTCRENGGNNHGNNSGIIAIGR